METTNYHDSDTNRAASQIFIFLITTHGWSRVSNMHIKTVSANPACRLLLSKLTLSPRERANWRATRMPAVTSSNTPPPTKLASLSILPPKTDMSTPWLSQTLLETLSSTMLLVHFLVLCHRIHLCDGWHNLWWRNVMYIYTFVRTTFNGTGY